jgi:GNAT superfamily N-acetyltransferase
MQGSDLAAVSHLAASIHPAYPEDAEMFDEKLRLFPYGCLSLQDGADIVGYCFSHPWTRGLPPALNELLGELPAMPDTYFIHDVAIDPRARGQGVTSTLLSVLVTVTRLCGLSHMTLIAVNNSEGFWRRAGFVATTDQDLQRSVRLKYSNEAIHMEMPIDRFF